MKCLIKLANFLDSVITRIAIYAGLSLLVVLAVSAYTYLLHNITPPALALSNFIIDDMQASIWLALPLLWGAAKALKWGLKVRNWWVHTEDRKLATGIRGLLDWRFSERG